MGAAAPMHHLQKQIESNGLHCVGAAGGLSDTPDVLFDIWTRELTPLLFGHEPTVDPNLLNDFLNNYKVGTVCGSVLKKRNDHNQWALIAPYQVCEGRLLNYCLQCTVKC